MNIHQLIESELEWANDRFAEVDFVRSTHADFIAVAEINGSKVGLGRVVPISPDVGELGGMYVLPEFRGKSLAGAIVDFLISKSGKRKLFCIPFGHLEHFYMAHGFQHAQPDCEIPAIVDQKYKWCQRHYDQPVSLLVQNVRT